MRDSQHPRKLVPVEPVVILTLIGMILTGALLYYRSVNFQRFLEPSLAVLEPRTIFASRLSKITSEEIAGEPAGMVVVKRTSIMLHKSLFTQVSDQGLPSVIPKLSRALLKLLSDDWMAANIEMIIVKTSFPLEAAKSDDFTIQNQMREQSDMVLKAVLGTEPALAARFADRFASTAVYSRVQGSSDWITLAIIPSERLHIEVLERLGKYAHKPSPTN